MLEYATNVCILSLRYLNSNFAILAMTNFVEVFDAILNCFVTLNIHSYDNFIIVKCVHDAIQ